MAQPCCGSRATVLRISRSRVPCGRSIFSDAMREPLRFYRRIACLAAMRKGEPGRTLRSVTVGNASLKAAATYACAEKAGGANCFAGAQCYFHLVCDWSSAPARRRHEVVLRRGSRGGIAAGWGLLAYGVGGGYRRAAADPGNRVRALQTGNRREIAGAAVQFPGDESADDCRH